MTQTHAIETALSAAIQRFHAAYPEIVGLPFETIERFATERFVAAVAKINTADTRFMTEAPDYAYRCFVREAVIVAQAIR